MDADAYEAEGPLVGRDRRARQRRAEGGLEIWRAWQSRPTFLNRFPASISGFPEC